MACQGAAGQPRGELAGPHEAGAPAVHVSTEGGATSAHETAEPTEGREAPVELGDAEAGGQTATVVEPEEIEAPSASAPPAVALLVIGQSNALGVDEENPPAGLPDASIPFWRNDAYYADGLHVFGPLDVYLRNKTFSHAVGAARALRASGRRVAVIKLGRGGTYIDRFLPSGYVGKVLYPELTEAWKALPAQLPTGTPIVPLLVWDQGEEEARYPESKGEAGRAVVARWAEHFAGIRAEVERIVGGTQLIVVRTSTKIANKSFPGVLEDAQASVVDDPADLIDTDDLEFMADGVHRSGKAQSVLGERIGARALAKLE